MLDGLVFQEFGNFNLAYIISKHLIHDSGCFWISDSEILLVFFRREYELEKDLEMLFKDFRVNI
jgi:hypothetical protein